MNSDEQELLKEFKAYLRGTFDKKCVDAYLRRPLASSIVDQALANLEQATDEAKED